MQTLLSVLVVVASLATPAFAEVLPVNDDAILEPRPARLLSAYGLFLDGRAQTPNEGVHPFSLQQPLFTDYANKYRFVYMPKGTKATYQETEVFDFPVGTVLVKTFAYPADFRKPAEDIRLIETRLLIHQATGWTAWAYVWNQDQSDAVLKVAGKSLPVSWIDSTGQERSITYAVPNKNQCKGCHSLGKDFTPIGPKARNLNFEFAYSAGARNQLQYWSEAALLSGAPPHEAAPSVPAMDDMSASLNDRARAYMDINCAHCHRLEGPASTSGLFLTYGETNRTAWGYKKRPVAAGRGSGGFIYDIVPGDPDRSILLFRMTSNDPGIMMPELGRSIVDDEGIALLSVWIKGLK